MIGRVVSHYKILEHIGGGGMGIVYKAQDLKLDRLVALKFLPPDLTRDPEAKQRFVHEARAACALDHPNICNVHDVGETDDGQLFIVMAFYEGETLKKRIERGPLKVNEAIGIAIQVAQGLTKSHEQNVVHRDIKPANIIITQDGTAKIVDFGLARLGGQTRLTKTGSTLGTAAYMSPEQARGEPADHRTDIWSMGVLIFEMLAGKRPFDADYENALLYAILNTDPEPITGLRTGVPKDLEAVVLKCLAKAPQNRYQHVDDVLVDLRRLQTDAQSPTMSRPARQRVPKSRAVALGATALIGAVAIATGIWWLTRSDEPRFTYDRMKSIGVLPFVPLNKTSADTIFAAGIHDDILTQLSKLNELRVIARTTMIRYGDTKKGLREIGKELDTGYLLEGSIRRAGGKLRITAQLINTETEGHVWADVYERNEADVFAIQSDIANRIAGELNLRLSPSERSALETPMTSSPVARDYYAKGQYYWTNYFDRDGNAKAAEMFDSAASRDPTFVEAQAWAATVHSMMYWVDIQWDHSVSRKLRSRAALDRAIALAPDHPDVKFAKAYYYRYVEEDKHQALSEVEAVLRLRPRWAMALGFLGGLYQELGELRKAREMMRERRIIDPSPLTGGWEPYKISAQLREWDLARREAEEYLAMHPDDPLAYSDLSNVLICGFGDLEKARAVMSEGMQRPASSFRGGQHVGRASFWPIEYYARRFDSALACTKDTTSYFARVGRIQSIGLTLRASGDVKSARLYHDSARVLLEAMIEGGNTYLWNKAALGTSLAVLGRHDEAIRMAREAIEASSRGPKIDLFDKPEYEEMLAQIYVIAGRQKEAIDLIEDLLTRPGTLTVWKLRFDPLYDPLRSNQRFQKLVSG